MTNDTMNCDFDYGGRLRLKNSLMLNPVSGMFTEVNKLFLTRRKIIVWEQRW